MFDPDQLRTFLAVSETLNFTRAAARLSLSQPTVSQHVRKLEDAAGRRLLDRDTRGVAASRGHRCSLLGDAVWCRCGTQVRDESCPSRLRRPPRFLEVITAMTVIMFCNDDVMTTQATAPRSGTEERRV